MKKYLANLLLFLVIAASCSQPTTTEIPVISVTGGQLMGVLTDSTNVVSYKGIPYAAPPVGELRWKRPQPVIPWDTVMIADTYGKIAIQGDFQPEETWFQEFYWMGKPEKSEDCLYLNVWTPATAVAKPAEKLPVAMFIHGGAFNQGFSNETPMDGDSWAKRGVVLVTINYRVGTMGFFTHPLLSAETEDGHSGNYGIYDQLAALQWIKENIAQFGGDPDNIMVFGESAGAMSVKLLTASPLAKNDIKKAFIQSGGGIGDIAVSARTHEESEAFGKEMMDCSGYTTLEAMRAASVEDIFAAEEKFKAEKNIQWLDFRPLQDDNLITESFANALLSGRLADVPIITSRTGDDSSFCNLDLLERFCQVRDSLSDQPVYLLSFDRKLPGERPYSFKNLAFHDCDIWFSFGTLNRSWRPFTAEDYRISNQLIDYLTNFAKYGTPNGSETTEVWDAYTKENPFVLHLDVKE